MKPTWLALTSLALPGCGAEQERIDDILALEADVDHGSEVYAANCAECHATDGSAIEDSFPLAGTDIRSRSQEFIVETILDPPAGMIDFADLPDQDIADVSAYAESL